MCTSPKRAAARKERRFRAPQIGRCRGTAYYLLYNGVLGDRRPEGGNILAGAVLEQFPQHEGARVIFGEGCRLGEARLRRERITFKQIPYQARVS